MKIPYNAFDNYILRTPLLSFDDVLDLDLLKVRELCARPDISEAIFLASPDLHSEMTKYLGREHLQTDEKLLFSLFKYLLRMGTRCTPFGLFGGCSLGRFGENTKILLGATQDYGRVTRLDMNYLCALSQKLDSDHVIREQLLYYPNTSLYQIGEEIRYVEYQYLGMRRKHFLMSIDANEFINAVLKKSEDGISIKELAVFISDQEVSEEEAAEFVHELIDNQILVSSISPSLTGDDYFEMLRRGIRTTHLSDWFDSISEKLKALDSQKNGNAATYRELTELAGSIGVTVNNKYLFQTDLNITCTENSLGIDIKENILQGIDILNKMSSKKEYRKLESFKKKFTDRFEEEEVPLTLALDVETGIGYGEEHEDASSFTVSNLIDDMPIPNRGRVHVRNPITKVIQTKLDRVLIPKMLATFRRGGSVIEFDDSDFDDLSNSWEEAPNTFSTIVRIYQVADSKPLLFMSGFGGSTASYLLSRFGHVDGKIHDFIGEVQRKETAEDAIFAEIVHLPESRTGNVLCRSNVREYEIPYLAKSSLPKDRQIPISDLMVSVRGGRVVLRSLKNNKQVFPLLSNAHNTEADPLPIYGFLTELQAQDKREHFGFKWGDTLSSEPYLPRVMYKNIIFSLETWRLLKNEIEALDSLDSLRLWRREKKIPNRVSISDLDNNLFVDFQNELSCLMFLSTIKNKSYIILKEHPFDERNPLIYKDRKAVANEFIVSFYKNAL